VSNINYLLNKFKDSAQVKQIVDELKTVPARIRLKGIKGAQKAFLIASTAENTSMLHVVICESKEEAAYLFNDLTGILGEYRTWFFPDSFKRPGFFDDLNATQILQRSETINKLINTPGNGHVVVTYPEALFERVVKPAILSQHRIEVLKGGKLDVNFAIEILIEYGFERTDFVYEPGQFSIRGGIIDLFSHGNDLPYRIELFDDEVERIQTFDPLTQLSKSNLESVSIVPNLNTRFRQDEKAPFLTVLPTNSVLWVNDIQFVYDRLQYCFEQAEKFASRINAHDPAELREIFRDRAFVYPGDIADEFTSMSTLFFET
jgi:transcription-repair coupling factor (superfamily II helicase)